MSDTQDEPRGTAPAGEPLSVARRVARIAWMDCADGATRRALACTGYTACPYGDGICPHHRPAPAGAAAAAGDGAA